MESSNLRCVRCKAVYVKQYRHYRTGKLMVATEYGYTVWRFTCRCRKP